MDILEKAYDYIDYTLEELNKLEEKCLSLLYFFKLFSPAGELAQKILVEHSFIEVEEELNGAVVGITDRGREVIEMGGIRNYLNYLDWHSSSSRSKARTVKSVVKTGVCLAAGVFSLWLVFRNHKP